MSDRASSSPASGPPPGQLAEKNILVAVTGGIAAFKAVTVVRELQRRGATVRVVMSPSATRFVGPITFTGITGEPPVVDLWDPSYAGEVHVELAGWADAIVVTPATMSTMGRVAAGIADEAVSTTLACYDGPVLYAPAMHHRMWSQAATQRSVARLIADGAHFVGPNDGPLASGEVGRGRMAEPDEIVDACSRLFAVADLAGSRVVVSAGPTYEDLDPVRFLGNRSTGTMGFAIAARAAARGASVTLVAGPTQLSTPPGTMRVDVRSAREMDAEIRRLAEDATVVVMAAAVADYRPAELATDKIGKQAGPWALELVRNPDILQALGTERASAGPILVGFALETDEAGLLARARAKLERKRADLIVANLARDGFGGSENVATFVHADGHEALGRLSKSALADRILDFVRARGDRD